MKLDAGWNEGFRDMPWWTSAFGNCEWLCVTFTLRWCWCWLWGWCCCKKGFRSLTSAWCCWLGYCPGSKCCDLVRDRWLWWWLKFPPSIASRLRWEQTRSIVGPTECETREIQKGFPLTISCPEHHQLNKQLNTRSLKLPHHSQREIHVKKIRQDLQKKWFTVFNILIELYTTSQAVLFEDQKASKKW